MYRAASRIDAARDPDAMSLDLDLDFGEAGLLEKLSELFDEVLIEGAPVFGHRRPFLARQRALLAEIVAPSASIASS